MGLVIKGAKPPSFCPGSLLLSVIILCTAEGNCEGAVVPRGLLGLPATGACAGLAWLVPGTSPGVPCPSCVSLQKPCLQLLCAGTVTVAGS